MKKRYQIQVSGKVQGVYFRASTREKAADLDLYGFVRNEPNGDVYIEAEGEKEQLESFVAWCRQGPAKALVDQVDVQEIPLQDDQGFEIHR